MAKYGFGESNVVENIFSDKGTEVSTFASTGDRINQLSDFSNRTK